MSKPSWDETFLQVAEVMARRSMCVSRQVGAVIADKTNRIVATGFNGPSAYMRAEGTCDNWCQRTIENDRGPTYEKCPSIHAEANALLYSDRKLREDGTLYITHPACIDCAKVISNSGIAEVVWKTREDNPRERDQAEKSLDFLLGCGIVVVEVFKHKREEWTP